MRRGIPKLVFLITDGKNNGVENPVIPADLLKSRGVRIFTVGVTSSIDKWENYKKNYASNSPQVPQIFTNNTKPSNLKFHFPFKFECILVHIVLSCIVEYTTHHPSYSQCREHRTLQTKATFHTLQNSPHDFAFRKQLVRLSSDRKVLTVNSVQSLNSLLPKLRKNACRGKLSEWTRSTLWKTLSGVKFDNIIIITLVANKSLNSYAFKTCCTCFLKNYIFMQ